MNLVGILKDVLTEQRGSQIVFPLPRYSTGLNNYGQNRGDHIHDAIDIPVGVGTPVYAPHSGTISVADIYNSYNSPSAAFANCGGTIIIDSTYYRTTFCHMSDMAVSRGQWVQAGDLVGYSGGQTGTEGAGRSDGPHLHWKLQVNGSSVNPLKWVSPQRMPQG